jgi:23S rRNA (adenine2503-C2)-methyltransferase|tara:strand:- start:3567 stop:4694 length:1128 start_codon:yes stop_codon:yes gene_type:complete
MPLKTDTSELKECATDQRPNLIGMGRKEMELAFTEIGEPKFRANQLFQWVYNRGVTDFSEMTNMTKLLRSKLQNRFKISRPTISRNLDSFDGTHKWLIKLSDGNEIETVHIPEDDRGTLCVSSQIGCTLNCKFCHTGTQRLVRNLSPMEIIEQIMVARDHLSEWPSVNKPTIYERQLSNIVMMGMGEPLYNYDNVAAALKIIMDGEGIAISRRRITLSTAGVVPLIRRCGEELGVGLAVSLHAVRDDLRDEIVPINRKYPLAELLSACREYPGVRNSRRITFEYVMLKDVNDSLADARELVRLIAGIPAKVNLIPFNPWPGSSYERSSNQKIEGFAEIVRNAGYPSPVRKPRGEDIMAACGQLKSDSERGKRGAS